MSRLFRNHKEVVFGFRFVQNVMRQSVDKRDKFPRVELNFDSLCDFRSNFKICDKVETMSGKTRSDKNTKCERVCKHFCKRKIERFLDL